MYEFSISDKEQIQNLGLVPKIASPQKTAELNSEKLIWIQTNLSITVFKLSHIVLRLGKTPSEVQNYWPGSCRALPPAPAGRKTSRTVIALQDGSLCMVSSNTGQVLTVAHTITLSDRRVVDINIRQDGFVMYCVLSNGVVMELDISASPATRLLVLEPEKSSHAVTCVTTRMVSITAVPLYEPPTFIGLEVGYIQILQHKLCQMSPVHAHSCGIIHLISPREREGSDQDL